MNRRLFDAARIEDVHRLAVREVVKELVDLLGRKTVAYLAGLNSVREVTSWLGDEGSRPKEDREAVLRSALQAARYIGDLESQDSAAAWCVGTNPGYDFESPAAVLRRRGMEGRSDVVRAARSFVADALAAHKAEAAFATA